MSRSRWAVLLGPPLILALAMGAGSAAAGRAVPGAGSPAEPRAVRACPGVPALPPGHEEALRAPAVGAWRRSVPKLDAAGGLAGWRLTLGDGAGRTYALDLPAASTVSGPERARVIAAVDDGARSVLRVLDAAAGCERTIELGGAVVRRAIADPTGDGFLAHLLARGGRADLGIWHVAPDGRQVRILEPIDDGTLRAAGIDRVWATNLALSPDGGRLAVQSCDPRDCVTRLMDRRTGRVRVLRGDQGDLVGFAAGRLVTFAACPGLPCGLVAWRPDGAPTSLAMDAVGAAAASDGTVVIMVPRGDAGLEAVAVEADTGARHDIGVLADDAALASAGAELVGVETGPHAVGLVNGSGSPSALEVQP